MNFLYFSNLGGNIQVQISMYYYETVTIESFAVESFIIRTFFSEIIISGIQVEGSTAAVEKLIVPFPDLAMDQAG